jgi:CBS domain-containing membrane protein
MELRVSDLMTEGVFAVQAADDLETVSDLMDERSVRHIPVVDENGKLIGLVSQRDLLRNTLVGRQGLPPELEAGSLRTPVGQVMTRGVVTAEPRQDIRVAARVMLENKFGCLPVVDGTRLVGILTESDFVRLMAAGD